jgi:hypothetical protein
VGYHIGLKLKRNGYLNVLSITMRRFGIVTGYELPGLGCLQNYSVPMIKYPTERLVCRINHAQSTIYLKNKACHPTFVSPRGTWYVSWGTLFMRHPMWHGMAIVGKL